MFLAVLLTCFVAAAGCEETAETPPASSPDTPAAEPIAIEVGADSYKKGHIDVSQKIVMLRFCVRMCHNSVLDSEQCDCNPKACTHYSVNRNSGQSGCD